MASGPDKAGAWPALPDGYGSGERVEEVYARNRCVKPPKVSHQLQPGGYGWVRCVLACLWGGQLLGWSRWPVWEATVKARMTQMVFEAHPVTKERWPDLVELFDRPIVRTRFCMFYRRPERAPAPAWRTSGR